MLKSTMIPQIEEKNIGKNYDMIGPLKETSLNIRWFKEEKIDEAIENVCEKVFSLSLCYISQM